MQLFESDQKEDKRKVLKRFVEVILFVLIAGACVVALLLVKGEEEQGFKFSSGPEISLRNATKGTIHYGIKPNDTFDPPEQRVIKQGEVHHYRSLAALVVNWERIGVKATRNLTPGRPYAFRYDENYLIQIYEGSHGRDDAVDLAPYVATPMEVVVRMLEMAEVDSDDIVYDIGCGDGRIVVMAAKKYGARGVGIDIDPHRIEEAKANAAYAGVEHLLRFYLGDATKMDFSEATVVALYLLPESNEILRPMFEKQLKPGTILVTHNYRIPGWKEKEIDAFYMNDEFGKNHSIFLYRK
jgi:2-polyprenyl-3-methyl-5-hydroxy-6-metoxy-1,4-benzoquinol methylase